MKTLAALSSGGCRGGCANRLLSVKIVGARRGERLYTARLGMIGYWLLPADAQRTWCRATIEQLAQKYDAPVFEPHVTLYSGDDEEEAARALVDRVATRNTPVELSVERIEHSEKFTKTLFVQFAKSSVAQQLSDAIRTASRSQRDYEVNPHLSLVYAHISEEIKAAEAERIRVPFDRIRFDAISAMSFPKAIKTRADVEGWRLLAKAKLSG
jgi:2'-5' RNA ligase